MGDKIPADAFKESKETLGKVNPREDLISAIDADCTRLKKMCWDMRSLFNRFDDAKSNASTLASKGKPFDIDSLLSLQNEFTNAERDIYELRLSIEERVEKWNCGKSLQERIVISHTTEGLPIRVEKLRKIPLWGI